MTDPDHLVPRVVPAPALDQHRRDAVALVEREAPRPPAVDADVDRTRPLTGIRILQLGSGAVVPEACATFALLGAEVLRIESRVYPDFLRRRPLDGTDIDNSPTYNQLNLGVKSVAVDMGTIEGSELVRTLVEHCDIVVENMRAPVVERWGLAHAEALERRSDIVSLSSQGMGRGRYGKYQTFGPNLVAFTGKAWLWSHPDDPHPVGSTLPHPDHTAGKQAFVSLLGALLRRDAGEGGCFVEAAQMEVPAWHIADRFLELAVNGDVEPWGNRSPDMAPHGCYPCTDDRWIAIAVEDEVQWAAFRQLAGSDLFDPAFDDVAVRVRSSGLDATVAAWTAGQDVVELERRLRAVGICCSRVVSGRDMAADTDAHESGFFARLDYAEGDQRTYTGLPVRSVTAGRPETRLAPRIGQHTDEVLSAILGVDGATLAALRTRRIIGH